MHEVMLVVWKKNREGIKLLIYMGKYDLTCNWFSNSKWVNVMQWFGKNEAFTGLVFKEYCDAIMLLINFHP